MCTSHTTIKMKASGYHYTKVHVLKTQTLHIVLSTQTEITKICDFKI